MHKRISLFFCVRCLDYFFNANFNFNFSNDLACIHSSSLLSCIDNRGEDTLLDRIAIALGDENQILAPNLLYPHLYRPLLSAFDASPSQQIMHVNAFL
ncbi:MAG TPA: hypothetical protein VLE50_09165 [Cellvibrio sp.]|nr:hypothetical protein [Cellvibrio sp.]